MKLRVHLTVLAYGCWALMAGAVQAQPTPAGLLEKLKANGCTACHAMDKKSVGPSFKEVAARYKTTKAPRPNWRRKSRSGAVGLGAPYPCRPKN